MCASMYTQTCIHARVFVCLYMSAHICAHTHTHAHTHAHTHTQRRSEAAAGTLDSSAYAPGTGEDGGAVVLGMPAGGFPVLVGASRKSFIGHVLGDGACAAGVRR